MAKRIKPPCHVVGCLNDTDWSIWPQGEPYAITYLCPVHIAEELEVDKSYVIEPWATELSEEQIALLLEGFDGRD